MGKELLKWMAAGLSGILLAVVQRISSGEPFSVKSLLVIVASGAAYRLGSWLVAKFGPQPAP